VVEEISLVLCLLSKQEKNFLCSSDQKKNWVFIFQNVGSWEAESIKAYVKVIFKKSGWLLARPWIEFPGGIFLGEGTTPHQSVTKRQLSKCCAVESRACKKEILSESAHTALSHGQVQEGQLRPKLAPGANEGGVCQDKVGCVRQHGLHNPKQACNLKDTNTTLCGRGDVYLLCKQADSQSPSMLLVTQASQQVADGSVLGPQPSNHHNKPRANCLPPQPGCGCLQGGCSARRRRKYTSDAATGFTPCSAFHYKIIIIITISMKLKIKPARSQLLL
jgi:hypothetical protein